VVDGALQVAGAGGAAMTLADPAQFVGYRGDAAAPEAVLLVKNGLHAEIVIDRSPDRQDRRAGISDVVLESAMSTIMDCEDSVAAVDAEDKVVGLPQLARPDEGRSGRKLREGRQDGHPPLAGDRTYTGADGKPLSLHGRSLMLVRNVGHLMTNAAMLDRNGNEVPEGIWMA
jgi:malate synthase